MKSKHSFSFRDVVLVADVFDEAKSSSPTHLRRDLEMTDTATLKHLVDAISSLGLFTHHYADPEELANHASKHNEDIVLSIYGGHNSRNRMALVPAICETFGIKFIGPDVYGRIIAQDKEVSKRLALDCGIKTPAWRIIRNIGDIPHAMGVKFPVVVKPLLEGSSIGISQRNKVLHPDALEALVIELLETFAQPVLVEEFVAGREVAYSCIERAGTDGWSFSEVFIEGNPDYFKQHLFDADEKLHPTNGRSVRNIDADLTSKDRLALALFVKSFSPYGYCRVDGRFMDGHFHFLELTPDAWIAPRGQLARSFTEKGWSYDDVIGAVLASAG